MACESFLLTKWYMDCVSEDGRVFIGYAATLRWRWLHVNYMSAIERGPGGEVTERSTLRGHREPEPRGESLHWRAPRLQLEACWTAASPSTSGPPRPLRLLDSDSGRVDWTCHLPRARARVEVGGRAPLSGLGYVEKLELTVKPWMLPIDELRWGRFLTERDSVVWIEWRGAKPLTLVIHDGTRVEGAVVSDAGLQLPLGGTAVRLDDSLVLREGTLGATALRSACLLRPFVPRRALDIHERKQLSRGSLVRAGEVVSEGWAIHEVVRWS